MPKWVAILKLRPFRPLPQRYVINPKEKIVNPKKSFVVRSVLFSLITLAFAFAASAQNPANWPTTVAKGADAPKSIAVGNNLYCAGFIQASAIDTGNRIIGGQGEADRYNFGQNDFLYINMGRNKGVNVGDVFSVVRPRGEVNSDWTDKDYLGFYVQEVGAIEVVNVKQDVAVARIKSSCDAFYLGDLVQLAEKRTSPLFEERPPMDPFGDPSGKVTGRILMSRDAVEMIARDFIVYVDLGADDNIAVGNYLTIFRPLAKGNVTTKSQKENLTSRNNHFQSDRYKGGKFSNQAGRKSGDHASGNEVTTKRAKEDRPEWLRKVVGEAVVLNVKERTATVLITRNAQEIHPGDWVELQ